MSKASYRGLLAIGDPHLASRVPGFRKDEYAQAILRKLEWCLGYANEQHLVPCLLGDMFHWPRDNANWLLGAIFDLLKHDVLAIAGNHDCAENTLGDDDSLSVIARSGRLRLLDRVGPWRGIMNGRPVAIGGSSWGQPLPGARPIERTGDHTTLVFWLLHENVRFPGYDAGHIEPRPIPGIDVVINGHIHQPRDDVVCGRTVWLNPGNIARVKRSDSSRDRVPSVLQIEIDQPLDTDPGSSRLLWGNDKSTPEQLAAASASDGRRGWSARRIEVPHEPFDQVFHEEVVTESVAGNDSAFVRGLAELICRRTESGAGLRQFLQQNITQLDPRVAQEIMVLADEVLENAHG